MMFDVDAASDPPLMPKIEKGNELDGLVSFDSIIVLQPEGGRVADRRRPAMPLE